MQRRRFLQLSLIGMAGALASCVPATPLATPAPATPISLSKGTPAVTRAPSSVPPGTILGNQDAPGFYVRYYKSFPALDPAKWALEITGLVIAPLSLTLEEIEAKLPRQEQSSRMKCVEGWSSRASWGGFTYTSLAGLVKPKPEASHVRFSCADGYWEDLAISELQKPRALFVTHMNGEPLPGGHGAPLRMIVPWLYGYKGAKAVTQLEFTAQGERGYWSTVGPYTVDGAILAGSDYPLDLPGDSRNVGAGEVTAY
jgi:methionine sulfoxide reductase catalytic subunit